MALCFNRAVPMRYRWFLSICVVTWILGPLQHITAVLLVGWLLNDMNTSPVTQSVVILWALNFAYVVWTYWEGAAAEPRSRRPAAGASGGSRSWWSPSSPSSPCWKGSAASRAS
ncbi:hypothetical protein ACRAWF_24680 [Streptomyces sp. L7]